MIYISRAPIPRLKNNNLISIKYKKQVCIYSYFKDELKSFLSYGRKSFIENIEDIEILRFFELNKNIKMFQASKTSLAVDEINDLGKVEKALKNKKPK